LQQNKPFKSKHASKSSTKEKSKGRVPINVKRSDPRVPPLPNTAQAKQNRRNQARQIQKAKRQGLIEATRIFNGVDGAPRIVAVVPLCADVSAREAVLRFAKCLDEGTTEVEKGIPEEGVWLMRYAE
jgi:pre-rRNA-processing protein TSR1